MRPSPWRSRFAKQTYASGILWAGGLVASWITGTPDQSGWLQFRTDPGGMLFMAAAIIGGANFAGAGFNAARSLKLDMNFLMTAALTGALLIGEPFEAATLAFLFSFAELLERFAVDRGRRSLERLLELAPDQAERLLPGGGSETIPAPQLTVGDTIRVRPGGRIAADGRVISGASSVNEATITGESMPRTKQAGDQVFASTFNTDGVLDIAVTADAEHSTLARIVQLVKTAEASRAPIEHAIKRFARVYTPIVVMIAAIVMIVPPLFLERPFGDWFIRGLTLMVVACPCALVIATPVTVVSGLTSAARHGVLIKGGEHLETLGAVRALAVDKTGTLTTGQLEVLDYRATPPEAAERLLRAAAAIESHSEHPIAEAVVEYAEAQGVTAMPKVEDFEAVPGKGVRASVDGQEVLVGTETFVGTIEEAQSTGTEGLARIYARSDDGAIGVFTVRDSIRPAARDMVAQLHGLGIRPVVLLTGDHAGAAMEVARAVGIDDVRPRLLPEQKVDAVRELRAAHGSLAMIGDGVNDAPALAQADLGIAMGAAGSPATIDTADIALMGDDLGKLPYAVRLARRSRHIVRFNIALALGLKLLLVIGTMAGVVTLAAAVLIGDMGGTLAVTANALRLARTR